MLSKDSQGLHLSDGTQYIENYIVLLYDKSSVQTIGQAIRQSTLHCFNESQSEKVKHV